MKNVVNQDMVEFNKELLPRHEKKASEIHYKKGIRISELFEEDGEIISRKTIENSIDHGIAYRIREDCRIFGGLVLKINEETQHNELELLFVNPEAHRSEGY